MSPKRRRSSALARSAESPTAKVLVASAGLGATVIATGKIASARAEAHAAEARKRRYRLDPEESPKQGVSRVARGELDLTIGLLESHNQNDGGKSVHEARKALKRTRALLRVSRPALTEARYRRENVIFRDAGRELSGARDAQVLLETLDSLLDRFGNELPRGSWRRLRHALEVGARRAESQGSDGHDDVLAVLTRARRRVGNWRLPSENGRPSLVEGFERIYRRGRRARHRAKAEPTPENLHELRKRAKDLWHAAQLLEPQCPETLKPTAKAAHHLSDLLGDDHDLSVLLEYADQHPRLLETGERERLQWAADQRRKILREEAMACASELYGRKPKRMLRQLELV